MHYLPGMHVGACIAGFWGTGGSFPKSYTIYNDIDSHIKTNHIVLQSESVIVTDLNRSPFEPETISRDGTANITGVLSTAGIESSAKIISSDSLEISKDTDTSSYIGRSAIR